MPGESWLQPRFPAWLHKPGRAGEGEHTSEDALLQGALLSSDRNRSHSSPAPATACVASCCSRHSRLQRAERPQAAGVGRGARRS